MKEINQSIGQPIERGTIPLAPTELTKAPLLTPQQEIELGQAIESGLSAQRELLESGDLSLEKRRELKQVVEKGNGARLKLIIGNTRFAINIAKRYQDQGLPFPDLVQEGLVGLVVAVGKFDWRRGYRFSTCAYWWIRHEITRAIENNVRTIRIPGDILYLANKISQIEVELQQGSYQKTTIEEIGERLRVKPAMVERVLLESRRPTSLDESLEEEEEMGSYELVADQSLSSPEEVVFQIQLREAVNKALLDDIISPKEVLVLELRYGLKDNITRTLQQIGMELGLSRERVRQLESRAFDKLRNSPHAEELRCFLLS